MLNCSFSEDDVDELEARMSRFSNTVNSRMDSHARSKSVMRYNEIERERSKRRQNIVKQKTTSKFSPGTMKLSLMNAGLIPLKKGRVFTIYKNVYVSMTEESIK